MNALKINPFFQIQVNFKLEVLTAIIDIKNIQELDINSIISGYAPLENAKTGELTFFLKPLVSGDKYISMLQTTQASFCFIEERNIKLLPKHVTPLIVSNAYIAFMTVYDQLTKNILESEVDTTIHYSAFIHPSSHIKNGVKIGERSTIDSCVKIGSNVSIGNDVYIMHGACIEDNCVIGDNTIIHSNVSIKYSIIGKNCIIHPSTNIGQDGFGFVMNSSNNSYFKVKHYGFVSIGENVELGASVCVDRGVFTPTVIGNGTKIGNLSQIAHNVIIGTNTVLAGKVAIGGSAEIGNYCMIGGSVSIVGHVKIGDQSYVYGGSNVANSFPPKSKILAGWPAEEYHSWARKLGAFNIFFGKQKSSNKAFKNNSKASFYSRALGSIKLFLVSCLLDKNALKN